MFFSKVFPFNLAEKVDDRIIENTITPFQCHGGNRKGKMRLSESGFPEHQNARGTFMEILGIVLAVSENFLHSRVAV